MYQIEENGHHAILSALKNKDNYWCEDVLKIKQVLKFYKFAWHEQDGDTLGLIHCSCKETRVTEANIHPMKQVEQKYNSSR